MKVKHPKKRNILVRLLLFLLAAAVVIGALAMVVFRDVFNMDALRRWFAYRTLSVSDSGQASSFHFSGLSDSVFANVEGDLLVCSNYSIALYSSSGTQYVEQAVSLNSPAVSVFGGSAVVYDAGGSQVYVLQQRTIAFECSCDGSVISAHLNASGMLTVVSQESGYRGVVTIYKAGGEPKAALRLSSIYVMEAALADDGTTLFVISVGEDGGTFVSTLSVYDLGAVTPGNINYDITPVTVTNLGNNVILNIEYRNGLLWALGDQGATVLNTNGSLIGSVGWTGFYLRNYSVGGDNFAIAHLARHQTGGQGELYLIGEDGTLLGTLAVDEQVLSLDASGRYFAVLTPNRLDIYTSGMKLYSSLSGVQGAKSVLLHPDGSAFLIYAGSAQLYVPS